MRLFIILLTLFNFGCSSDILPDKLSTVYSSDKVIQHDSLCKQVDIVDGENMIFRWVRDSDKSLENLEDDFYEELMFEVPMSSEDSFILRDSLFSRNTLIYRNVCTGKCTGDYYGIQNGEIRGVRLDSLSWDVSIDVDLVDQVASIIIQELFSKGEI